MEEHNSRSLSSLSCSQSEHMRSTRTVCRGCTRPSSQVGWVSLSSRAGGSGGEVLALEMIIGEVVCDKAVLPPAFGVRRTSVVDTTFVLCVLLWSACTAECEVCGISPYVVVLSVLSVESSSGTNVICESLPLRLLPEELSPPVARSSCCVDGQFDFFPLFVCASLQCLTGVSEKVEWPQPTKMYSR